MSAKAKVHGEYSLEGHADDVATFTTISNIAERMSTIPPGQPSQFGFSSFELRCIRLAIVDFGHELLEKLKADGLIAPPDKTENTPPPSVE